MGKDNQQDQNASGAPALADAPTDAQDAPEPEREPAPEPTPEPAPARVGGALAEALAEAQAAPASKSDNAVLLSERVPVGNIGTACMVAVTMGERTYKYVQFESPSGRRPARVPVAAIAALIDAEVI